MSYSHEEVYIRLHSKKADDRRVAAVMIGKARLYDYAADLVNMLIHDPDASARAMAAFGLDMLGSVEAIPDLIAALYDESFDVRSNAGWALVHLADRMLPQLVVPDVIDVLRDEAQPHARHMAYLVLSNIRDDLSRQALTRYWPSA